MRPAPPACARVAAAVRPPHRKSIFLNAAPLPPPLTPCLRVACAPAAALCVCSLSAADAPPPAPPQAALDKHMIGSSADLDNELAASGYKALPASHALPVFKLTVTLVACSGATGAAAASSRGIACAHPVQTCTAQRLSWCKRRHSFGQGV